MVYLKALAILLQYIPLAVQAVEEGVDFIELCLKRREADRAIEKAKATKDTSDLDKILGPKAPPGAGGSS
jgi:hypothetical protein